MKLPFVSRGRYDDMRKQVEELKAERQVLLDRLMMKLGQAPLSAKPIEVTVTAGDLKAPEEIIDEEVATIRSGRTLARDIVNMANRAARSPKGVEVTPA